MWFNSTSKTQMPSADDALPGRDQKMQVCGKHFITGRPITLPNPKGTETALFGLGCFWGAERLFWELEGVFATAVGYAAGYTKNPTYEEVCSGKTGHNEVVLVIFDPAVLEYQTLLAKFFEGHDPTQGMRQGNDVGTQYRSGIYTYNQAQKVSAVKTKDAYENVLKGRRYSEITTEIIDAPEFYYAEEYHQQYLAKNPGGYCGLGGTGVSCPTDQTGEF
ncbi:MAG: peptide-methionine (S)-S-oxide reductase MsrA [Alphaproteobacteria bacterium]